MYTVTKEDLDEILKDAKPDGRYRDIINEFIREEMKGGENYDEERVGNGV